MYKRKFHPPALHKPAAPVAPASAPAVPKWTNDAEKDRAKRGLADHIFGDGQSEKENSGPPAAFKPVQKKQKLFIAPQTASSQPLRPVQQKQQTAAGVSSFHDGKAAGGGSAAAEADAPSARVFSVLYTKREKWKVRAHMVDTAKLVPDQQAAHVVLIQTCETGACLLAQGSKRGCISFFYGLLLPPVSEVQCQTAAITALPLPNITSSHCT